MTREEAYDIIETLNQTAYDYAYQQWIEAGDDEELREEASVAQQGAFRELYDGLDVETRRAIHYYVRHDEDFAEDFNCWYGEE